MIQLLLHQTQIHSPNHPSGKETTTVMNIVSNRFRYFYLSIETKELYSIDGVIHRDHLYTIVNYDKNNKNIN